MSVYVTLVSWLDYKRMVKVILTSINPGQIEIQGQVCDSTYWEDRSEDRIVSLMTEVTPKLLMHEHGQLMVQRWDKVPYSLE